MAGDQVGHRVDGGPRVAAMLDGGDQAEVARRNGQLVDAGHGAENGHPGGFAGLPQHLLVAG